MRGTKRLFLLVAAVALLPLAAECAKSKTPAEKEEAGRAWFGVPSIPSGKKGAAFKLNDDDNKVVHLKQVRNDARSLCVPASLPARSSHNRLLFHRSRSPRARAAPTSRLT